MDKISDFVKRKDIQGFSEYVKTLELHERIHDVTLKVLHKTSSWSSDSVEFTKVYIQEMITRINTIRNTSTKDLLYGSPATQANNVQGHARNDNIFYPTTGSNGGHRRPVDPMDILFNLHDEVIINGDLSTVIKAVSSMEFSNAFYAVLYSKYKQQLIKGRHLVLYNDLFHLVMKWANANGIIDSSEQFFKFKLLFLADDELFEQLSNELKESFGLYQNVTEHDLLDLYMLNRSPRFIRRLEKLLNHCNWKTNTRLLVIINLCSRIVKESHELVYYTNANFFIKLHTENVRCITLDKASIKKLIVEPLEKYLVPDLVPMITDYLGIKPR